MPQYVPPPVPFDLKELPAYLWRELKRVGLDLADSSEQIFYRTIPATEGTFSAGLSANWKIASGNVVRVSTSATQTITGIALKTPNREIVVINVGTGVLAFKSAGTESSASYRFQLGTNYQLSADYALTLWYDLTSSRWRAIART